MRLTRSDRGVNFMPGRLIEEVARSAEGKKPSDGFESPCVGICMAIGGAIPDSPY